MNNQTIDHTITAANGADGSGNCRSKNIAPYDLTALRGRAKAQSGRIGFLTDEQRAQMPHVVRLPDLSRATLGDARFERIYGLCIHSAELIARRAYWAETVVENHARVGYAFGFSEKLAALRFALCHEAAMQGRPLPLARMVVAQ